jgi:hypothetical protein
VGCPAASRKGDSTPKASEKVGLIRRCGVPQTIGSVCQCWGLLFSLVPLYSSSQSTDISHAGKNTFTSPEQESVRQAVHALVGTQLRALPERSLQDRWSVCRTQTAHATRACKTPPLVERERAVLIGSHCPELETPGAIFCATAAQKVV